MAKRVLIFAADYLPHVGGAELAVKEITDRLSPKEFSFVMIVPRYETALQSSEKIGNVMVYRVGFGTRFDKFLLPFLGFFQAFRLVRKEGAVVIWGIMASYGGIAASFFKKCFPNTAFILTLQEGDEEEHLKRYAFGIDVLYTYLIRPWHLLPFRTADRLTVISMYLKNRALKAGVTAPISIVPNGVALDLFARMFPEKELQVLRGKLGKKEKDIFLITTSRLVKKNAVGDIIQALAYLPQHVRLLVVGEGQEHESLRSLGEVYGVAHRVKFLGKVPQKDIPPLLAVSDIFVRPSLSEGFGNSFVEAMAAGIPVIGTPVGGIVDFLKDKETGIFVAVHSPKDIARKVELLLADLKLRKTLVVNARKLVMQKYSYETVTALMKEEFDKV